MTAASPNLAPTALRRQTLIGILCAVGASFAFSINDVAIKSLSGDYALHQVILFRSLIGMAFLLACVLPFHGGLRALRTRRLGAHLLRASFVVTSNLFYFLGLAALPLADTSAIFFVAPLLITALSVPLLGEHVGPRRWTAVAVGLVGVIIMLRPGGGMALAVFLPLFSALAYAFMHMMTRHLKGTEGAVAMTFYVQALFVLVSAVMGLTIGDGRFADQSDPSLAFLFRPWVWPPAGDWLVFLATGLGSSIGGILIAQAYRLGEAGLIAPFEYTAMPLAILWGLVIFSEWPMPTAWIGIALICGSGLYIGWRETRKQAAQGDTA
jgi:drug/metabolite transporter (DMT)-like permease